MTVTAQGDEQLVEQEQLPRNRAPYLFRSLVPSWRPTDVQALWIIRGVIALGVLVPIGYLLGAAFQVSTELFTGFLTRLVTLAGYWFQGQQDKNQRQAEEQRGQNSAVQEYFSTMKDLLIGQEAQPATFSRSWSNRPSDQLWYHRD